MPVEFPLLNSVRENGTCPIGVLAGVSPWLRPNLSGGADSVAAGVRDGRQRPASALRHPFRNRERCWLGLAPIPFKFVHSGRVLQVNERGIVPPVVEDGR